MTDQVLSRSVPFELRDSGDTEGNTLYGYAAVFNSRTRINSWEGLFDEEIAPDAFARSLAERTPVLQFDHGKHPLIGSLPLGYFRSLEADDHGLLVDAPLHDNWLVQPVRDGIKSKAIPGMSFRMIVQKDDWFRSTGEPIAAGDVERALMRSNPRDPASIPRRVLRDVDLFELGPVVFPAYTDTTVGVRDQSHINVTINGADASAEILADIQRAMHKNFRSGAEVAPEMDGTDRSEPSESEGDSGDDRAAATTTSPVAVLATALKHQEQNR